jgi:hypothetical protein
MHQADNPAPAPRQSNTLRLLQEESVQDLGEQRDWRAEADNAAGNVPALQAIYAEAEQAGADADTLDYIKSKAGA